MRRIRFATPVIALLTSMCGSVPEQRCEPTDPGGDASLPDAGKPDTGTDGSVPSGRLTREQLMDPKACQDCHPKQYDQWSRSMHAYAADDPVFHAMNKRGQRETNGALGDFCVDCHAPMAVRTGAATDPASLANLPTPLKGVTCYFCHSVNSIEQGHESNNPLQLADDGIMRGQLRDPMVTNAHYASYSLLHDRDQLESSNLCGTCHDIVNPRGTHIERTLSEWKGSIFSKPILGTTCGQCHMAQSAELEPVAAVAGAPLRRLHDHSFPGVDHATQPFPNAEGTARLKADNQAFLDSSLRSVLCVQGRPGLSATAFVVLDNIASGHNFPSGAAQDRRLWAEVRAFDSQGAETYSSGVLGDPKKPITDLVGVDPDLWLMRDRMFESSGAETHAFWDASCYDSLTLPAAISVSPTDPRFFQTHVFKTFPSDQSTIPNFPYPARMTLRVRLSPIGQDVIAELIESGDLTDLSARDNATVYDVGPMLEWTPGTANESYTDQFGALVSCISKTGLKGAADKYPATMRSTCPTNPESP